MPGTPLVLNAELIEGSLVDSFDEGAPDSGPRDEAHTVTSPPVEVRDDLNRLGIWGPHSEAGAGDGTALIVVDSDDMGPEPLPHLRVPTRVEPLEVPTGESSELIVSHVVLLACRWCGRQFDNPTGIRG